MINLERSVKRINIALNCLAVVFVLATLAVPVTVFLEMGGYVSGGLSESYLNIFSKTVLSFDWIGITLVACAIPVVLVANLIKKRAHNQ